ncbi:MAG: hypothetical protein ACE5EF_11250 [Dehalococcoidia bacterium]
MTGRPEQRVVLGKPRSEGEAQLWIDILRGEGIPATSFPDRQSGVFGAGGDLLAAFPVVVAATDLDRAREAIHGLDPDAELAPEEVSHSDGAERSRLTTAGLLALVSVPLIMLLAALVSWLAD